MSSTMNFIDHKDTWKRGTMVLLLKGRHKDGLVTERRFQRVTHDVEHFDRALNELTELALPNERIYATAVRRDMSRAIRLFKERMLENDYTKEPEAFFERLDDRWISCLMAPRAQVKEAKVWMFDCDSPEELEDVHQGLEMHYRRVTPYEYSSKSGVHVLVQPFDKSKLSDSQRELLHDNPLMLWGY